MPTTDGKAQHYNLRGYTAEELASILKRLGSYQRANERESFHLSSEGTVIVTDIPSEAVLSTIRITLGETFRPAVPADIIAGVLKDVMQDSQIYDLTDFTADEQAKVHERLKGIERGNDFSFTLISAMQRTDAEGHAASSGVLTTNLPSRAVLDALIHAKQVDGRESNGEPEMALFKITITQQDRHYEGYFLSSGPLLPMAAEAALQAGAAASGIQGPANVKYEQVQFQRVGAAT